MATPARKQKRKIVKVKKPLAVMPTPMKSDIKSAAARRAEQRAQMPPPMQTPLKQSIVNLSHGHLSVHKQVYAQWIDEQHAALVAAAAKAA